MEIQQLKGFQAVAKYRNFTVAAQKTLRTQPTISLQVKALEDELGVRLFERLGHKKLKLTPEGQILYDITLPIIDDFENITPRFNESRGLRGVGGVTVVTHLAVMVYCLPEIIKQFKAQFPAIQLSILNRTRREILSMIEEGEADLAVSSLDTIPDNVDYRVFSRFNRILIASKDHPLSKRKNITPEDLAEYPLILPHRESNTRKIIDSVFASKGLTYNLTMEITGREAIKTYVGMDLGISIMNEYFVSPENRKKLFVTDLSKYFGEAETGIITRKGKVLSPGTRDFIEVVLRSGNI